MITILKPDPIIIRKTLKRLRVSADHVIELRVLEAKIAGSYQPQTFSGFFDNDDALIREALRVERAKGWFITLNPILPDLLARRLNRADRAGKGDLTSDNEILRRAWLPIDLDAVRLAGISSNEAEHQAALNRARDVAAHMKSKGWPAPIMADSGNGAHLLYRIDLPVDDGGLVQRCLQALDHQFSDDSVKVDTSVFNPARIWKLYGTPACKGDSTPSRPHRMARLIEVPDGY